MKNCDPKAAELINDIEPFNLFTATDSTAVANQLTAEVEIAPLIGNNPIKATFSLELVPNEQLIDVVSFYNYIQEFANYRPCFETMVNKLFDDAMRAQPLDLVVNAQFVLAAGYTYSLSRNNDTD